MQELGLNGQPLPTEAELAAQEVWLDENWGDLSSDCPHTSETGTPDHHWRCDGCGRLRPMECDWLSQPLPHYHACRPFDRKRHHCNSFPCFDPNEKPEKQHEGYFQICHGCAEEVEHKYPMPDDGHDDPRYGGY